MAMHLHRRTLLQLLDHNAHSISPTSTITTCTCVFLPLRYHSRRRRFSASTRRRQSWNSPPGRWNNNGGNNNSGNNNGSGWNQNGGGGWTAPWQSLPNHHQNTQSQPQQQQQQQQYPQQMQPGPWNANNTVPNQPGWQVSPPPMPPAQGWNVPPTMNQHWPPGENIPNYPGWGVPWQPKPQRFQPQEQEQPQGDQQWTFTSNMPAQDGYMSPLEMEQRRNMPVEKEGEVDAEDMQSFGTRTLSQKELLLAQQMFEQELEQQQRQTGSDYGDVEGGNLDSWQAGETYDVDAGQSSEGNLGNWQSQEVYDSDIDQGSEVENQSDNEQGYDHQKMEQQSAVYYNQSFEPTNDAISLDQQPKEWQKKLSDWVESTLPSGIQGAGTLAQKLMSKYGGWDNAEAASAQERPGEFYNEQRQQWESMEWNFPETASFAKNLMAKYGIGDPMFATGYGQQQQQYYASPADQEYYGENIQGSWQFASIADDFSTLSLAQKLNARRGQMRAFSSDATAGQGTPEASGSQETEGQNTGSAGPAVPPPDNWRSEIPLNVPAPEIVNLADRLKKRHTSRTLSVPNIPEVAPLPPLQTQPSGEYVIYRPHEHIGKSRGRPGIQTADLPDVPKVARQIGPPGVREKLRKSKSLKEKPQKPEERVGLPTRGDSSNKLARALGTKLQSPGQKPIRKVAVESTHESLVGEFELPKEGPEQSSWPPPDPGQQQRLEELEGKGIEEGEGEGFEIRKISRDGLPLIRPIAGNDPDPEYQFKFYMNQKQQEEGPKIRSYSSNRSPEDREKLKFHKQYISKMLQQAQAMGGKNPRKKAIVEDLRREYRHTIKLLHKVSPPMIQAQDLEKKHKDLVAALNAAQAQPDDKEKADLIKDLTERIDACSAELAKIASKTNYIEWDGGALHFPKNTHPLKDKIKYATASVDGDRTILAEEIAKRSAPQTPFAEVDIGQARPIHAKAASNLFPQSVDLSSAISVPSTWTPKERGTGASAGAGIVGQEADESTQPTINSITPKPGPIIHQYFPNPRGQALDYSKSAANAVLNSLQSRGNEGEHVISNIQDGKIPRTTDLHTTTSPPNKEPKHNALRPLRTLAIGEEQEGQQEPSSQLRDHKPGLWNNFDRASDIFSTATVHTSYDYEENPFFKAELQERLKQARRRSLTFQEQENSPSEDNPNTAAATAPIRWSNRPPTNLEVDSLDNEEEEVENSLNIRTTIGTNDSQTRRRTTPRALALYYQYRNEGKSGKAKISRLMEIYPDLERFAGEDVMVGDSIVRPTLPSMREHALKADMEQKERVRQIKEAV